MSNINNGVLDGVRRIGAKVRDLSVDGQIAGAPLGFRLRGATSGGAPATGTFKTGDEVRDRRGVIWICTAGGTPGTWVQAGQPVVTASGDVTGAADLANITSALSAASSGQNVILGPGTFWVNAPIVLPARTGVSLCGQEGAMQGGSGSPGVGTIIRPTSSFASTFTTNAGATPIWSVIIGGQGARANIQDLWINGASLPATTVASGSNGGEISAIASWSSPSAGILSVASTTGFPSSGGTITVQASGSTSAIVTYTGISGSTFTGCAYVSGSATGTVATGGVVSVACDGINFYSSLGGHTLYRAGINNMTGWGVYAKNQSGSGGTALGFYGDTIIVQTSGTNPLPAQLLNGTGGGYNCGDTDCYHQNVHAQNNIGIQIAITSGDNRLVGCRADGDNVTGSTIGYYLSSFQGQDGLGLGVILIGCSTEGNNQQAVYCTGGGHSTSGPFQMIGCCFEGDGENGGSGGLAAIHCIGRVEVSVIGTSISCETTGTWPSYAIATAANSGSAAVPDIVQASGGGLWQVGTAFFNDAGPATLLTTDGSIRGFIGAQNGTSGTTAFSQVGPLPASAAAADASWTPADSGLASWSCDPFALQNQGYNPGSGVIIGCAFMIRQTTTISEFFVQIQTAGVALTSGQCYGLIYNSSGTLLGYTADQSTHWASAGLNGSAAAAVSLTAASTGSLTLAAGKYWAGAYYVGTSCSFMRGLPTIGPAPVNLGTTGSSQRSAQLGSGAGATPPSTATFTTGGGPVWFAVA